jgi:phage/plasmid primase-like uncharacterized protein
MTAAPIPAELLERARTRSIKHELRGHLSRMRQIRKSPEWVGPCPRCGGDDRFSINTKKENWNCRQCKPTDIKGDVIGLVQFLDNCSFADAVRGLAGTREEREKTPSVEESAS